MQQKIKVTPSTIQDGRWRLPTINDDGKFLSIKETRENFREETEGTKPKKSTPGVYFVRFHFIGITNAIAGDWWIGRVITNHLKTTTKRQV